MNKDPADDDMWHANESVTAARIAVATWRTWAESSTCSNYRSCETTCWPSQL